MNTIAAKLQSLVDASDARQVVRASNALGIPWQAWKFYANGQREPSDQQLADLAAAFGVEPTYFKEDHTHRRLTAAELASFCHRVRIAHERAGLNRYRAADWLADRVNYPASAIAAFLDGVETPMVATVERIATALLVKTAWLLDDGGEHDGIAGDAGESDRRRA